MWHFFEAEAPAKVGPVGQVLDQPTIVGAQELSQDQQGRQLRLGEIMTRPGTRVRGQGTAGDLQRRRGQGQG